MTGSDEDGVLGRWSRRKLAAKQNLTTEDLAVSDQSVADSDIDDPELETERSEQLIANREAAEAIDLDTLDKETDFSIFMKEGVPDVLRRKAMSALWRADPVFANVDGLVDYGEDFAAPDLVMKTFKSAWQAGRGYIEHLEALEEQERAKQSSTLESETAQIVDTDDTEVIDDQQEMKTAETQDTIRPTEIDEVESVQETEEEAAPRGVSLRKRMVFSDQV